MNSLIKTTLAAVILFSAGSTLVQANSFAPADRGPGQHRGPQGMPVIEHLLHALHQLDLSDDQIASIKAAIRNLKDDIGPAMKASRANKAQLRDLVAAESFDQDAVAEIARQEGKLTARRIMITSQALSEVLGYLTPEQRAQLDAMHAKRMQWRDAQ